MKVTKLIFFLIILLLVIGFYLWNGYPTANVLINIRLPRLILTIFTGFVLGGIGFTFQVFLNNPLADPYILGISSGAAFGSILASILGIYLLMPLFGFTAAILTMFLVWKIANFGKFFTSTKLLLSGIVISMFFSAFISLLMYLFQKDISGIINILMGNLGRVFTKQEYKYFLIAIGISLFLIVVLFNRARELIILTSGDEIAVSLGVNVKRLRRELFVISSFLTGIVVSYAGIIGFIGLIIPHLTRIIFGGNRSSSLLISALFGAMTLLVCDLIAMHITVLEIPVGIVTAFLGAPFFIYILIKKT